MSKTFIGGAGAIDRCSRVRIRGAGGRRNVRQCRMQQRTVQLTGYINYLLTYLLTYLEYYDVIMYRCVRTCLTWRYISPSTPTSLPTYETRYDDWDRRLISISRLHLRNLQELPPYQQVIPLWYHRLRTSAKFPKVYTHPHQALLLIH